MMAIDTSEDQLAQARSAAWWQRTRREPDALHRWLAAQYRGEVTAAGRIRALAERFAGGDRRARRLLARIAAQEQQHAAWVAALLHARGLPLPAEVDAAHERYWARTLPGIRDLESGAAVGAHAERMRLWRIYAIAEDAQAPADIRAVFARILPQERFHERAFRSLCSEPARHAAAAAHRAGMAALGLLP
jgi:rubrerythrin